MEKKYIIILSVALTLSILLVAIFGFNLLSVVGISNELSYENNFYLIEGTSMNGQTIGVLTLPDKTNEFYFTVKYGGAIEVRSSRDYHNCNVKIKYESFNYKTNSWNIIHSKTWSPSDSDSSSSEIKFDGEDVYSAGNPESIYSIETRISPIKYDYYLGCLDGMSSQQAKDLRCIQSPLTKMCYESTDKWSVKCLYPDGTISTHETDSDSDEDWDTYYFPPLINLNNDYINNSQAKFRISVEKSSGCNSLKQSDFDVDLWEVKTELQNYFRFENNNCSQIELMTYKRLVNDYETLEECEDNIILNVYTYDEEDNTCSMNNKIKRDLIEGDYLTEEECLSNKNIFKSIINFITSHIEIFGIIALILVSIISFIIYLKRR
jgi:hypothetical protein